MNALLKEMHGIYFHFALYLSICKKKSQCLSKPKNEELKGVCYHKNNFKFKFANLKLSNVFT